jgi:hypothetical protein
VAANIGRSGLIRYTSRPPAKAPMPPAARIAARAPAPPSERSAITGPNTESPVAEKVITVRLKTVTHTQSCSTKDRQPSRRSVHQRCAGSGSCGGIVMRLRNTALSA